MPVTSAGTKRPEPTEPQASFPRRHIEDHVVAHPAILGAAEDAIGIPRDDTEAA